LLVVISDNIERRKSNSKGKGVFSRVGDTDPEFYSVTRTLRPLELRLHGKHPSGMFVVTNDPVPKVGKFS
jgi:hypothetical protein